MNAQTISKYELLQLFNRLFKDDKLIISHDDTYYSDKSLVCTRIDGFLKDISYEQMLFEMKQWIDTHLELYPHY